MIRLYQRLRDLRDGAQALVTRADQSATADDVLKAGLRYVEAIIRELELRARHAESPHPESEPLVIESTKPAREDPTEPSKPRARLPEDE